MLLQQLLLRSSRSTTIAFRISSSDVAFLKYIMKSDYKLRDGTADDVPAINELFNEAGKTVICVRKS